MTIYQHMLEDWRAYCLMMSICYIEEMSKPTKHVQLKKYKNKVYECTSFHSLRLKMKDPEVISKLHKITLHWEKQKGVTFLGDSYKQPRKEKHSQQDQFYLSPVWLNHILATTGPIPSAYAYEQATTRVSNMKYYTPLLLTKESIFSELMTNKFLAAGAFIISMDLECKGMESGKVSLCMSKRYKDFLEVMRTIAYQWGWTIQKELRDVNIESSLKAGIKASPQFMFTISIKGLQEIYELAGPLANSHKDKCVKFHVIRSKNYINIGGRNSPTRSILLQQLQTCSNLSTTDLQFQTGVRPDVVLDHLHKLEKEGLVTKNRNGKRYVWNHRNSF